MKEFDKILDSQEKVLWEGVPRFWPFFLGRSIGTTIFGVFWMAFVLLFIVQAWSEPGPMRYIVFMMPHFWVGLGMLFGPTIYSALVFRHTHYAITDKWVILQSGWIGRDFEIVDFDQVANAEVNVGFFDKIFGGGNSGSILISTAGSSAQWNRNNTVKPYTISNVANPYDVFKFFKRVTYDVKTDIQYPNKLRPTENPGYQTQYDPNQKSG